MLPDAIKHAGERKMIVRYVVYCRASFWSDPMKVKIRNPTEKPLQLVPMTIN